MLQSRKLRGYNKNERGKTLQHNAKPLSYSLTTNYDYFIAAKAAS